MKTLITSSATDSRPALPFDLIAAPFTPMKKDGAMNLDLIEPYAERLYRDGLAGVFVGGTSGEGMSLTQSERIELATRWKQALGRRLKFIVHVGHASMPEAISLARHASTLQADGIAAIGPIFFSAAGIDPLVAYCRNIAQAAPDQPFYYYHMPSMSRVPFSASELFIELAEKIPTFRGIKFTHEDLPDYERCLKLAGGRYEIFFGRDELLLQGIQIGARSAFGSTYNFAAPLYLRIAELWQNGDHDDARRLQDLCTQAISIMVRYDGLPGIRATFNLFGFDCGAPRLPLRGLSPAQMQTLQRDLEKVGFLAALSEAKKKAVRHAEVDLALAENEACLP